MFLRGVVKSTLTIFWTGLLLPLQLLALKTSSPLARHLPLLYHRGAARILGLHITISGQPCTTDPVLYVANHASWLDIVALGSILKAGFIAKHEVADWPGFGLLAKLQQSIFIDRSRHQIRTGTDQVSAHLATGKSLILFPEGTSNDGISILPFQSSFFSVAEQTPGGPALPVQPVSIRYTHRAGLPLVRSQMPAIAWYGDMFLMPHLWQLFCEGGGIDVVLNFHAPADMAQFNSRKALAKHCYDVVRDGGDIPDRSGLPQAGS